MKAMRLACATFLCTLSLFPQTKSSRQPHVPANQAAANEHYISALMQKYHLESKKSPFTYQHKTEIFNDFLGQSMAIPDATEDLVRSLHSHLNNSFFYKDISILNNSAKVRAYQLKKIRGQANSGHLLEAKTADGHTIRGTLLNRHSSTLVVVGAGFTNARETMAPFGDMFEKYDILSFDYRGHGFESQHPLRPATWTSLSKRIFGIDRKQVTLGQHEDQDVKAIIDVALKRKKYDKVVGLGICYSTLNFVKVAAKYPNLFDQLILDGTWFSLQDAAEILVRDPGMLARPQVHTHLANNWLVNQRWFQRGILAFAQRFLSVEFSTISILDYAPYLSEDLELLFFHGKKDVLIPKELFEIVWHAVPCRHKTGIITSNEHVWNHLKQKEFYKEACELFIDKPYEQFTHLLVNPEALVDYKTAALQQQLG